MARTSTRAALAGLVLALASACGGDDRGGGNGGGGGASPSGGDKSGPEAFDPCALLEVAEVEEQFGQFGPVGEPTARGSLCDPSTGPHTDRLTTLAALIADRLPPDFVGP